MTELTRGDETAEGRLAIAPASANRRGGDLTGPSNVSGYPHPR